MPESSEKELQERYRRKQAILRRAIAATEKKLAEQEPETPPPLQRLVVCELPEGVAFDHETMTDGMEEFLDEWDVLPTDYNPMIEDPPHATWRWPGSDQKTDSDEKRTPAAHRTR